MQLAKKQIDVLKRTKYSFAHYQEITNLSLAFCTAFELAREVLEHFSLLRLLLQWGAAAVPCWAILSLLADRLLKQKG